MDLATRKYRGKTLLMHDAEAGLFSDVEKWVRLGADVHDIDNDGRTALILAASEGHHLVVRLLLDHGADANAVDHRGRTACRIAASEGHHLVVKVLLDHGADVNVAGEDGETALIRAARRGHLEAVQDLVAHGAQVDAICGGGKTALMWAVLWNQADTTRVLLHRGANASLIDREGHTARDLTEDLECIRAFREWQFSRYLSGKFQELWGSSTVSLSLYEDEDEYPIWTVKSTVSDEIRVTVYIDSGWDDKVYAQVDFNDFDMGVVTDPDAALTLLQRGVATPLDDTWWQLRFRNCSSVC